MDVSTNQPKTSDCYWEEIHTDILKEILRHFQQNEESFFVSLVCKRWKLLIKQSRLRLNPRDVVNYYAKWGTLPSLVLLRQLINEDTTFFDTSFFHYAKPEALELLYFSDIKSQSRFVHKNAILGFAAGGRFELLKSVHDMKLVIGVTGITNAATSGGNLEIVKWAVENGYQNSFVDATYVAEKGYLDILKWLHQNTTCLGANAACTAAAKAGQWEVVKWLHETGYRWDASTCAASVWNFEWLQWLVQNGCPWDESVCKSAAEGGYFDVLKWLRSNGCPWNSTTCSAAAEKGHFEILKWAHDNGCPWNKSTCASAAMGGQLEILKYLVENGCNWDKNTCAFAATNGHLEILKWAREKGCEWGNETCEYAAKNGHLEVLKWARANGCPWNKAAICGYAARSLEIMKWTFENGGELNENICETVVYSGNLKCLKWIRENGCPWIGTAVLNAITSGFTNMAKWAIENGCPWKKEICRTFADVALLDDLVKWIDSK